MSILVDSSVWITFFRGDRESVSRLDPLLAERHVAITGPIYAEVLSGCRHHRDLTRMRIFFRSLTWIAESDGVWDRVAETRFLLLRKGKQSTVTDLMIALAAESSGSPLMTRDRDFTPISEVIPLTLLLF